MHHLPPFYSTFGAHNNHLQVDLSSDIDIDTKDSIGVKSIFHKMGVCDKLLVTLGP